MSALSHAVRPGGLSDADRDFIFDMAERGRTAGSIARKIGKHPSTVHWFMLSNGLVRLKRRSGGGTYLRNGRLVRRYSSVEEDALLLAERERGASLQEIAAAIEAAFGHKRSSHSLQVRLTMLACCGEADCTLQAPVAA